jgi:type IV pilus assembly protein PilA
VRTVRGLTMIEVLVVLGIMAILALMAVPALQDRIIRDRVAAALPLADVAKTPIALAWAATQTFPADNASAGLPIPEKFVSNYVSSVAIANGAIHITFGNSAGSVVKGKILSIRPAVVADAPIVPITWVCGNADWPVAMRINGENKTDLPANFLPVNCRAP